MSISTKGRYALRIMIDIAIYSNGSFVPLKDIAARQDISAKYLEQIISLLNKAGFLHSLRGNNGGYKLAKRTSEITAGDILRAAEGTLAPISCLQETANPCEKRESCETLPFWKNYYKIVNDYVDSVTLEKLTEEAVSMSVDNYSI